MMLSFYQRCLRTESVCCFHLIKFMTKSMLPLSDKVHDIKGMLLSLRNSYVYVSVSV